MLIYFLVYIDLLFYNRKLKRLVAIDLKTGDFRAEYKGQMELYLRWLAPRAGTRRKPAARHHPLHRQEIRSRSNCWNWTKAASMSRNISPCYRRVKP